LKKILTIVTIILVFVLFVFAVNFTIAKKIQSAASRDALTLLKEGNARFLEEKAKHPSRGEARRKETARYGQNPYAIVLTCADSRVPVEVLFHAGVGDIFVVENAGNVAQDAIVAGSIEYAVKYLNTPLLVILGHTDCGAVKAALKGDPVPANIEAILKIIEPAAAEAKNCDPPLQGTELLNAAIKNNVLKSKTDLLAQSEIIRTMSEKGRLKIVTAVYDIETGTIEWGE
jgi:carbonic anhydrase